MAATAIFALPLPVSTDAANIPSDVAALGNALDTLINRICPLGTVDDYAGGGDPAGGYFLRCDGRTLNAVTDTTLAALFAVIGTTYGGTGSNAFKLPDFRGRVAVAPDNFGTAMGDGGRLAGGAIAATGGEETHTLSTAELASHSHADGSLAAAAHAHGPGSLETYHTHAASDQNPSNLMTADTSVGTHWSFAGGGSDDIHLVDSSTSDANDHAIVGNTDPAGADVTGATSNSGSGNAHNNMPPYITVNKIIRVR